MTDGQSLEQRAFSADKRLLLGLRPALELSLTLPCVGDGLVSFHPDKRHGCALPGISSTAPLVVHRDPRFDVIRQTDVEGLIGAADDVHEGHLTTMN
jgi:hypothetical protein